jgi:hypothetical protein
MKIEIIRVLNQKPLDDAQKKLPGCHFFIFQQNSHLILLERIFFVARMARMTEMELLKK